MEVVKVNSKGAGVSSALELETLKYTEEALKRYPGKHDKIVKSISEQLGKQHGGKWTVLLVDGITTKWEIEYFQLEDKYINFTQGSHQLFVYKSG